MRETILTPWKHKKSNNYVDCNLNVCYTKIKVGWQ